MMRVASDGRLGPRSRTRGRRAFVLERKEQVVRGFRARATPVVSAAVVAFLSIGAAASPSTSAAGTRIGPVSGPAGTAVPLRGIPTRGPGAAAVTPATGPVWESTYDDPTHGQDVAFAVAASPDGSTVFVTGLASDRGDYATVA